MGSTLFSYRSGLAILIGSGLKRTISTLASAIGHIKVVVPEGPDHPHALLDACLAFYPTAFAQCASMKEVQSKLAEAQRLDFDLGKNEIPQEWYQLRSEAKELFRSIHIFEAELKMIQSY